MTLRSPVFRKLLFSAFLLILVTVVVLDFYITRFTAAREVESVERQLEAQARVLTGEAAAVAPLQLEAWVKQKGAAAGSRITVISPAGVVMGDSQHEPESMENHANRPEIREALAGRKGKSIRHSATLDRDLVYLAFPLVYQGRPGYVFRLAVPLSELDAAISQVRWHIVRVSLIAAVIALVLAYLVARSFTGRIRGVQSFAEGLVNARFTQRLEPAPDDELGDLARALNRTAEELHGLVERLSLESARREAILSSMVEGVLAVDSELRVTFCNGAFAKAVGIAAPVPERLPVLELVRDPEFLEMLTGVLVAGQSRKQRLQLAAAGGRWFEIQVSPLEVRSRRGAIALLHDITDIEKLERVRRDFVGNVSHELRTPLAAIQGYAETLLHGALEDKEHNREFLGTIQKHAVRLNHIASDLLVLSDLESGQEAPAPQRVSLRAAVASALHSVESEARARGVRVIPGALGDETILGHPIGLEQALVNLLDNAVKFNRSGGEVSVDTGHDAGRVWVAISDTGIGIPSEDLPRIFERFYRVDKARSREVGGTGLGLAIVKHIVERMGGTVAVESELGRGSKFTLYFRADQP